jgi:hypothetical protein
MFRETLSMARLVTEKAPQILNKVYELQHFRILSAKSLYKAVDVDLMIQFTIYTQVRLLRNPSPAFPSFVYRLIEFEQAPDAVGKTENFIGTCCADITFISALEILYTSIK